MKTFILAIGIFAATVCSARTTQPSHRNDSNPTKELYGSFSEPSKSARPRVWWHWMNGNITRDGIRKDLHWMHDAGIVGFHNFDAGLETPQIVEHRIPYMTAEWKETFKYALSVADSLDMEVTIASSPGWSETGGPWVSDDEAMKKLVWRELEVSGPKAGASISLPEGFSCQGIFQDDTKLDWDTDEAKDYYRDIAVVAVRLKPSDTDFRALDPTISASGMEGAISYDSLNGDSFHSGITVDTDSDGNAWIQYQFAEPQTIRAVVLSDRKLTGDKNAVDRKLFVSMDGKQFTEAATLGYQAGIQKTYSIKPTTGRVFRVQITDKQKAEDCQINVFQYKLSAAPRIQDAVDKAGFSHYRLLYLEDSVNGGDAPSLDDVVDLTSKVKDGKLDWDVPAGRWRIFRFGYSLTGKTNHPASPEATGLEVDKMDPVAVRKYLENYLSTYQDASGGKLGPNGISHMLTDSYEAGPQTWTGNMFNEFKQRKGYDLHKWMPALTGMVLGSTQETERFLFDWRRCIGEMIAEYHYDIQNEVLAQYGMKRYTESHEAWRANQTDGMDCKRKAEIPMSAFWMMYNQKVVFTPRFEADIRESASVAHIYGQNIAAAESFTSDGVRDGAWVYSPSVLKPSADAAMAAGLNRFVVHCSVHQPVDDMVPGLGLGKYGQWFNRHQTWADEAKAWTDYLSRSCEMLQQGRFVADIAVYYGEDNNATGIYQTKAAEVPAGYNYDYFSPSVLLDVAKVKKGRIVTPTGMSYRLLSLGPNCRKMSIEVLRKIKEIADGGVLVCGPEPEFLAGLHGSQAEFKSLVASIWHSGRKNVRSSRTDAAEMLHSAGVLEDVDFGGKDVLCVHRTLGNGEIYWVSNRTASPVATGAWFRTTGKKPVIWHAEDASREDVSYRTSKGRTCVDLELDPYESVFVMFLDKGPKSQVAKARTDRQIATVEGKWEIRFQERRGAPGCIWTDELKSFSESEIAGIRYFSGAATYSNIFNIEGKDLEKISEDRIILDLGKVKDIAVVKVNGKDVCTVWHEPYRADITDAVKEGVNTLEIKIVNVWHNRIVGDMQDDCIQPVTYYPIDLLKADEPLLESGLMGPVTVVRR